MTYFERTRIDSPSPMMRLVRASVRGIGEPFIWGWNRDEVAPYLATRGFHVRENRSLDDAAHDFLPSRVAALVQGAQQLLRARRGRVVALQATMRRFEVNLAHADKEMYETLELRVAQHPSESERYLVTRVLARIFEHAEGLEFSKGGVSDDSEPALVQRDLRGDLRAWIEVGSPTPDRLHKAAKACQRVVVYTWKSAAALREAIAERKVHRATRSRSWSSRRSFSIRSQRRWNARITWDISVTGGVIYLTIKDQLYTC